MDAPLSERNDSAKSASGAASLSPARHIGVILRGATSSARASGRDSAAASRSCFDGVGCAMEGTAGGSAAARFLNGRTTKKDAICVHVRACFACARVLACVHVRALVMRTCVRASVRPSVHECACLAGVSQSRHTQHSVEECIELDFAFAN